MDENGHSTVAQPFWQALKNRETIKELAVNPLLLTLLCIEFEQSSDFPRSRAELYERALNVLLSKWDGQRQIRRDEVYRRLPIKRKESLLGQLAMQTFERGDYFFKTHVAERAISQYIQNLPDASTDPDALLVDSRVVLQSIEAQHGLLTECATGIYSFSHLTFHKYFTAKNILDAAEPVVQQTAIQNLVSHVSEKRWREVFFLVAERMDSADYLLTTMKQYIDQMLAKDEDLQRFLNWVMQKSQSVDTPYKPAAIRAFYLAHTRTLALAHIHTLARVLDYALDHAFNYAFDFDRAHDLAHNLNLADDCKDAFVYDHVIDQTLDLVLDYDRDQDPELQHRLQVVIEQLLNLTLENRGNFNQGWQTKREALIQQYRAIEIQHRNIGYDWQFSNEQKALLRQYYDANLLLVQCLNSECYVSREVRREIEETLLLPIAEIEARQFSGS